MPKSKSKQAFNKSFGLPSSINDMGTIKNNIPKKIFKIPNKNCKIKKYYLLNYSKTL